MVDYGVWDDKGGGDLDVHEVSGIYSLVGITLVLALVVWQLLKR